MEHLYNENAPKVGAEPCAELIDTTKVSEPAKLQPANVKPCRYGSSCSRPDCKFSHPDVENAPVETTAKVDIGAKCATLGLSWIPDTLRLNLHENGKLTPGAATEEDKLLSTREYELLVHPK